VAQWLVESQTSGEQHAVTELQLALSPAQQLLPAHGSQVPPALQVSPVQHGFDAEHI